MAYHLPMLRIRCEWCKLLFSWHPQMVDLCRKGIRRCCGPACSARLIVWEKSNRPNRVR